MSNKMFNPAFLNNEDNEIPKEVKKILETILSKDPGSLTITDRKVLNARIGYISDEYIKLFNIGGNVAAEDTKSNTGNAPEDKGPALPSFKDMKDFLKAKGVELPGNPNKEVVTEAYLKAISTPVEPTNTSEFEIISKELVELGITVPAEATLEDVKKMLEEAKKPI